MTFLCLTLGMALSAHAGKLKIGTVNMMILLNGYHEKKAAEEAERAEMEDIKEGEEVRVEAIKAVQAEMEKMQNQFNDPSLAPAKRQEIQKKFEENGNTLKSLVEERKQFLEKRKRELDKKMLSLINDIRTKVSAAVQAHAATVDVDLVFDESGLTSSRVPFLLYTREPIDLTEAVLEKLNKDAPQPIAPIAPETNGAE